jgi:tRNA modification GTPase
MKDSSTICALSTAPFKSAIAVIRVSGKDVFNISSKIVSLKKSVTNLASLSGYSIHRAKIHDNNEIIDDVLITIFREPFSYTGENMLEISCHGSTYIQQKIIELLLKHGARLATPGEFTLRAFLNGKYDLSEAEAISDLISSNNKYSHEIAMQQMRGGFKTELSFLRERLLNLVSLIELELDFSEEDVEFADRSKLSELLKEINHKITYLKDSFEQGNVLKNGIPVTITGKTNVGKSTLLNAILKEEKAIVSHIPGTTRDVIEDVFIYRNVAFRFADTAGIRHSVDEIEKIGIQRTIDKVNTALIILVIVDSSMSKEEILNFYSETKTKALLHQEIILILNKTDNVSNSELKSLSDYCIEITNNKPFSFISISAKQLLNIEEVLNALYQKSEKIISHKENVIISNVRHFEALHNAQTALQRVIENSKANIPSDLISQDIREVLYYLGLITGEVTNDEILGNIFKNFCIGK